MTEPDEVASPAEPPRPQAAIAAPELAALLAGRLCHDVISPASAIVSGLDLLDDPTAADMQADAMSLIAGSARKLVAQVAFARVAFGASSAAETFDPRELETLTRAIFAHVRADLDWAVMLPGVGKAAARALLNLAQLAGGALPTGGVARITASEVGGEVHMAAEATGARVRLRPEVIAGLKGEALTEGLSGHWVQAYYLHAFVSQAGGEVEVAIGEGRAVLRARVPA